MSEFEEALEKETEHILPHFHRKQNFIDGARWAYSWFEDNVEGWIEQTIGSRDDQWDKLVNEKVKLESQLARAVEKIKELESKIDKGQSFKAHKYDELYPAISAIGGWANFKRFVFDEMMLEE